MRRNCNGYHRRDRCQRGPSRKYDRRHSTTIDLLVNGIRVGRVLTTQRLHLVMNGGYDLVQKDCTHLNGNFTNDCGVGPLKSIQVWNTQGLLARRFLDGTLLPLGCVRGYITNELVLNGFITSYQGVNGGGPYHVYLATLRRKRDLLLNFD